jgi:phosphatidylinositol phospholipase C delta
MIADIMLAEFGDRLVRVPPNGMPKIEALPSPEDLKGKILLKVCFFRSCFCFDGVNRVV